MATVELPGSVEIPIIGVPQVPVPGDFKAKYLLSVLAASTAEVATYPLDIIKTRMQVQGEDLARQAKESGRVAKPKGFLALGLGEFSDQNRFSCAEQLLFFCSL